MIPMPRMARLKTPDTLFHIMIHSITERILFLDNEDKDMYLYLIKKCKYRYHFKLYAFCLMDTHGHFIIDCFGSDISRIMHYINLCYSMYYNKKYVRQGPLFHDRFKSKIVDSYKYLANLSLYIHANPKDLPSCKQSLLDYPYNSLIDYLHTSNRFSVLDPAFLYNILGLESPSHRTHYLKIIEKTNAQSMVKDLELPLYSTDTKNEKIYISRVLDPHIIISYVCNKFDVHSSSLHIKYNRNYTNLRAVCCFMLNSFSQLTQKEICSYLGNVSQSNVSQLITKGYKLLKETTWIEDFIKLNYYSA